MVMDSTLTPTAPNTRAIGWMTNRMVRARRIGQMAHSTKAITSKEKSTDLASSCGLTGLLTTENLKIITFTEMAVISGQMGDSTKEPG